LLTKKPLSLAFALFLGLFFSAAAVAENSIGLSLYGAFSGTTTGNGVQQSPSAAAGGMFELRHIRNPIFGFEGTYSYNRSNQVYRCSGTGCPTLVPQPIPANAHSFTADWIPSLHFANLRAFGVLGIGALFTSPSGSPPATQNSTQAVYVYGAGLDVTLIPHFGLRLQYRGNLNKAPDLSTLYTSVNAFKHTAQPMAGLYIKF
jgi:opacity protein-like surface antigen